MYFGTCVLWYSLRPHPSHMSNGFSLLQESSWEPPWKFLGSLLGCLIGTFPGTFRVFPWTFVTIFVQGTSKVRGRPRPEPGGARHKDCDKVRDYLSDVFFVPPNYFSQIIFHKLLFTNCFYTICFH